MDRAPRNPFPRDAFDSTAALLRDGYEFISKRCLRHGSDAFETRLMLRAVTCTRGRDAAAMFYHPGRFTRRGAVPPTTVALLQGFGSVQLQDGADHRQRKRLFLDLLDANATAQLVGIAREQWRRQAADWSSRTSVELHPQVELILCRAVCRWAGVPLPDDDAEKRARQFGGIIDGAGAFGPRMVRGLAQRRSLHDWIGRVIRELRDHDTPEPGREPPSPAHAVAFHRDSEGALIEERVATIELINLLRPTVAVARWVTFAAVALQQHPGYRTRLQAHEPGFLLNFVQEVRRYYPFFPMVGGRVLQPFDWQGKMFARDEWVLLDLYGTNHDARCWREPQRFDPDRFGDWNGDPFDFIPQGGGDVATGHRCPGENPAIALLMDAVAQLVNAIEYEVPEQDLSYRMNRFPSIPQSRFVMHKVRPVSA